VLRRGHRLPVFVRVAAAAAAAEEALEHRVLRRQRLHRCPRREAGVPGEVLAALRRELLAALREEQVGAGRGGGGAASGGVSVGQGEGREGMRRSTPTVARG
jgi:hypothetical protein